MAKGSNRPQAQKARRTAEHQARVMDLRNGSRTSRQRLVTDYRRKPKHAGRGWEDA